jgi:hypothetical protein
VAWLGVMDEQGRLGVKRCAADEDAQQHGLFGQPAAETRGKTGRFFLSRITVCQS